MDNNQNEIFESKANTEAENGTGPATQNVESENSEFKPAETVSAEQNEQSQFENVENTDVTVDDTVKDDFNNSEDNAEIINENTESFANIENENPVNNGNTITFQPNGYVPVMPVMSDFNNKPKANKTPNKGIRTFAVIIALLIFASACVTGGYFFGSSGSGNVKVDLAEKPRPEDALTVSQIFNKVNSSIVGIYCYNSEGIGGSATGVIYSKDGYIVTNDHIYAETPAPKFKVYTSDGKTYDATFVAGDTRSDLAVIKVKNPTDFKPATFGNSDEVAVGEEVVAIGRTNGATNNSIASQGIVSSVDRRTTTTSSYNGKYIQTDTAINPGSSGGALSNLYGQVIGITSAKLVGEYEGVGFAIPTTTMKKVVDSLIKNKCVKGRAKLGISYYAIDELTAEIEGTKSGLQIGSIDKSSDLYGKSVEENDIITAINGTQIKNSDTVLEIIENSKAGDTIDLTVYSVSKKKSFDISVKLLEDTGSSSYTTKKSNSSNKSSSKEDDDENDNYNPSEFNFPNGD